MRAAKTKSRKTVDPGEVVAVVRRVLAENGRDYVWHYVVATLCMAATAATTAFTAWIMRDIIDEVFYRQRWNLLPLICGAIIAAFTIRGVASYTQAVLLATVGNNIVARYQRRIFDHLMRLGIEFFTATRSGQLAAQISQNVTGVRDLLNLTLTSIARDGLSLVGLVIVMFMQDAMLTLLALLIGPPLIFSVNYLMRRLRRVTREAVEINSHLLGAMQEATHGISIIKAFTMEEQLSAKIAQLIARAEGRSNKIARVSERLAPITEMLAGFAIAGVLAYAGYRATTAGEPPGSVFSFITALLLAYDPARRLAKVQVTLERSLVNARMIYEILDIVPQQRDEPGAGELKVGKAELRFENVSFAYTPELPVLRQVSFTAEAGKTTAIVGPSGAGKSTLFALVQRFYDLSTGRIEIDGQDIAGVTKHSLRRSIAYVSQQPYLFEGSIRDNIRYGRPEASDEDVEEAARQAYADEFIRLQPQGYDTLVGENGVTLSGGQRQRLSIARAIVRNAPILLLDEATSALDTESEARVQQALEGVMRGRTTLVIAHRLSTVVNADEIVVMEEGKVVERGTHASLVHQTHGIYSRFYRMQSEKADDLLADSTAKDVTTQTGDEPDSAIPAGVGKGERA